ncbi:LysR family transcriptional regulator [Vibrio atypicus]|uniref:LysR family transcriptional regulator n=1 Tax=Vibrio atypicus TaxID=558271 RepID=UPI001357516A|nr:LysR family transcriptional regulator [Vibrio atypicus]
MAKDLFANLDLNLLRTFIILHQERNMRKAAERLFVSQPAVSKALQRLRDHFDDELFVKTHHGLRATDYSNTLADNIGPLLDQLSNSLNATSPFKPNELDGVIKIALAPFILSSFASDIFLAIRTQAPNLQVQLLNWSKSTMQELINDEVLIGVNYEISHAPKELISKKVAQDSFHIYLRKDHPYEGKILDFEQAAHFEFATIIAADWNSTQSFTEKMLKLRNIEPNIAFRSELPSAVISVVENSDIAFPASKLTNADKSTTLRRIPIVMDNEEFGPEVFVYYHHKNRQNETTQWIKRILEDLLNSDN